ncbi:Rpn family recombination-promoting nuclease/putative transposase [Leyella stercorea]|jgi:predicted transposase/invertase (TIGR01784 family)|uniref:Rpn family recombination-promoting nuclease/putative transposase n=1 Tax=Leyella stercorea TaxID=363265 RepID=UPI0025978582|nr:Rpn family recombination-promoting nuclease/putative transposase [Leyella stercorea]
MGGLKDRYIRFDWAIKRLLRQKANFDVLEGFLTVFIGEEVKIVEILESEGNQQTPDDKFNRVDIKARNSKGEIILVEVQNTSELYYLERILYGVAKAITEHIHLGDTYKEVKKVYSISILYFDIGKGADYLYVGQNKFIGVHTNDQLVITAKEKGALVQKSPAEIFPEYILVRVNEFDKVAVTPLEEWVAYLKSGVIKENTTAPGLQEARKKLQYYSMTDAERYAYDEHLNAVMIQNDVLGNAREEGLAEGRAEGLTQGRAEGLTQGRAEGLTQGRAEGRAEAKKDIVKSMLSNGLSVEQAAKYSGLTVEEVESIK